MNSASLSLEDERARSATLNLLVSSGSGFIEKNWTQLVVIAAVVTAAAWIARKKMYSRNLKKQLARMKKEQPILIELIKKAQKQRYGDGTLPEFAYRVKLDSYQRRLDHLRRTIPVLEKRLGARKNAKKEPGKKSNSRTH